MDRPFDMSGHAFAVVRFEFFASMMQQPAGFFQFPVRLPLPFLADAFSAEVDPEFMAGGFDLLHGHDSMATIVMIREFQVVIGVGQFLAGRFGMGTEPKGQGQNDGQEDGIE